MPWEIQKKATEILMKASPYYISPRDVWWNFKDVHYFRQKTPSGMDLQGPAYASVTSQPSNKWKKKQAAFCETRETPIL